ncbi:MAG: type II toxin-antitoxin system RelE/ParE family toxin [Anaerolineales bacterium]
MPYSLKLLRDIEKQLERIPKKQRERLVAAMRSLSVEPRPPGCIKLDERLFRIRAGQYRIIYAVFEDELVVFICKTARRTESTYRDLRKLLDRANRDVLEE